MCPLRLFLFIFTLLIVNEQFLRFIPVEGVEHKLYYEYPGLDLPIKLDASMSQQVRVRLVEHLNDLPSLEIHCIVAELDSKYEIVSAELCFQRTVHNESECIDSLITNPTFGNIEFRVNGNSTSEVLDGIYYCKFRNSNGQLSSNNIEIQDVSIHHKKMITRQKKRTEYLPTLNINSFPLSLECGNTRNSYDLPSWADNAFQGPFRWYACKLGSASAINAFECFKSYRKHTIPLSSYFYSSISPTGTLTIYKRTAASMQSMGFICLSHLNLTVTYSTYFGGSADNPKSIEYDSSVNYNGYGIVISSPTRQEVKIYKGQQNGFYLNAVYRANPLTTKSDWSKDGRPIDHSFPEQTEFILKFPSVITNYHAGKYRLLVTYDSGQQAFEYDVRVIGPPEVVRPLPPVILTMEGNNVTFSAEITSFKKSSVEINGWSIASDISSPSIGNLQDQYPYLKNMLISPLHRNGPILTYSAHFIPSSSIGPSHTVTMVAENNYGIVRTSTLVRVLPQPHLLSMPFKYNCTKDCSNSQTHVFDCAIKMEPFKSTFVYQTWEFNGIDVSKMNKEDRTFKYFQHKNTKLTLLPVDRNMVELFAHSNLTCRFRIYYPEVAEAKDKPDWERILIDPKLKVYDTHDDPTLKPYLNSFLNLIADETVVAAGTSVSWITAILIAIIIIAVIGVLTTCIVMRSRGETYMLDREERALGNDPEKELREKEAFQTYERAEEPPLRGSRCSLNDDSAEIGSDADGELDDYNLDPGKFNEEGSFIDEYRSEKHRNTSRRLPVLNPNHSSKI